MLKAKIEKLNVIAPSSIPDNIPHGDMPGDKVQIGAEHIEKANIIFPVLIEELKKLKDDKAVISVYGGSGVGKSEIASVLAYYLNSNGLGAYILSGDNYPHRIPLYNDAERLRVFREGAMRGMTRENTLTPERLDIIFELQRADRDADRTLASEYPWFESYLRNGQMSLEKYLGSDAEIDFSEVQSIVEQFKRGEKEIWLRRLGRYATALWYDKIDFSGIDVLIIEWTHGNSDCYKGVDVPIFLNSTPEETLAHRMARNRDGKVDSPFTQMVLEIEQDMLKAQSTKAKIIVSKSGGLLSFEEYTRLMEGTDGKA